MCYQELTSQCDLRKAVENEKFIVSSLAVCFLMKMYPYILKQYNVKSFL